MPDKKPNPIIIYGLVLIAFLFIIATVLSPFDTPSQYTYSEVVGFFQRGEVEKYVLDEEKRQVEILKKDGEDVNIIYKLPNIYTFKDDVHSDVMAHNKENPDTPIDFDIVGVKPDNFFTMMIPSVVLMVVFVGIMMFLMRQMGGAGGMGANFGKVKARVTDQAKKVTFGDVAGADEEKEELVEVVEFLKEPGKYNTLGARIPKGVMLVGPPGTGKTLLARAVAGEAGVEFFSISGSDFVEMFVGMGASKVRDLFDQAKKHAPSVVFIDEIDAVGRQRGAGLGGGHDEREQTLNQLLVEMDGFQTNTGVIVIAATNRVDILDPALLRPGRFDRRVMVGYPDIKGREEILRVHSRNKPLGPDVSLAVIAKTTAGFTGADLENLMNEAALLAAKRNKKAITMEEIRESTIKVVMGPEKHSRVMSEDDRILTAYHEAGHAVASYHLPTQDPVHQVSIIPRGSAGGYTMHLPEKDPGYRRKSQMEDELIVLLGGRVAEEIVLGDISTGASSDLERASKVTRSMITRYGFNKNVGPIVYGKESNEVFLGRDYTSSNQISEKVASKIDEEVFKTLTSAYNDTTKLLTTHRDQLNILADFLLEYEKIESDQFNEIMKTGKVEGLPVIKDDNPTEPKPVVGIDVSPNLDENNTTKE